MSFRHRLEPGSLIWTHRVSGSIFTMPKMLCCFVISTKLLLSSPIASVCTQPVLMSTQAVTLQPYMAPLSEMSRFKKFSKLENTSWQKSYGLLCTPLEIKFLKYPKQNLKTLFILDLGKLQPVGQIWPTRLCNLSHQTLVQNMVKTDVNHSVSASQLWNLIQELPTPG